MSERDLQSLPSGMRRRSSFLKRLSSYFDRHKLRRTYSEVERYSQIEELIQRASEHPTYNTPDFVADHIMRRFMIARQYDVDAAYNMWLAWAEWKVKTKPEEVTRESVQREMDTGKATIEGQDKMGRPVVFVRLRQHTAGEFPVDDTLRLTLYALETTMRRSREQADGYIIVIIDCGSAGMKSLDTALATKKPGLLSYVQDYYPELLYKAVLVNTTFMFRAFLKLLMPFIDEKVRHKILAVSKPTELLDLFDVEGLPKELQKLVA